MDDLGGYIIQKVVTGTEVNLIMLVPEKDVHIVKKLSDELLGVLMEAPLTGVEIAVVSPTLASHHLPHSACDVAEYLRHPGANTNMIGLARGMGRRVSLSMDYERKLINDPIAFSPSALSATALQKRSRNSLRVRDSDCGYRRTCRAETEEVPGADLYGG
jgi:putative methanogenesis marker protein 7